MTEKTAFRDAKNGDFGEQMEFRKKSKAKSTRTRSTIPKLGRATRRDDFAKPQQVKILKT